METAGCEGRAVGHTLAPRLRQPRALWPVVWADWTRAVGGGGGRASTPGPGPGAGGRDPRKGLPGIHGGGEETLRREGSGFTRAKGD